MPSKKDGIPRKMSPLDNLVGQGYKGLGQKELKARKKQHLAMRDAALKRGNQYEGTYKQYYKVIGQHGDKLTTADSDSLYREADKAYVKAQSNYNSAKKWNKFYNKLGN